MTTELRVVVCVRPPAADQPSSGIGPADLAAVEYAVRVARRDGGIVTVVATGGDECLEVLREGIARGAHASVHVRTDEQSPDPIETASRLHPVVRGLGPSLVLCGTRSSVGMHGAVPGQLAALLGLPFLGSVVELDITSGQPDVRAVQALEHGDRWAWSAGLPMVCGVERELCSPRYLAVRRARRADAHQPATAVPSTMPTDSAGEGIGPAPLTVLDRVSPRIRPKKSKVPTAAMSAADRMKMLRGGKPTSGPATVAAGDDQPRRIKGDAEAAAREIIALLEKREVLVP